MSIPTRYSRNDTLAAMYRFFKDPKLRFYLIDFIGDTHVVTGPSRHYNPLVLYIMRMNTLNKAKNISWWKEHKSAILADNIFQSLAEMWNSEHSDTQITFDGVDKMILASYEEWSHEEENENKLPHYVYFGKEEKLSAFFSTFLKDTVNNLIPDIEMPTHDQAESNVPESDPLAHEHIDEDHGDLMIDEYGNEFHKCDFIDEALSNYLEENPKCSYYTDIEYLTECKDKQMNEEQAKEFNIECFKHFLNLDSSLKSFSVSGKHTKALIENSALYERDKSGKIIFDVDDGYPYWRKDLFVPFHGTISFSLLKTSSNIVRNDNHQGPSWIKPFLNDVYPFGDTGALKFDSLLRQAEYSFQEFDLKLWEKFQVTKRPRKLFKFQKNSNLDLFFQKNPELCGSNLDRGHLTPFVAACTPRDQEEFNLQGNLFAQSAKQNRGRWKSLELSIPKRLRENKADFAQITTGVIFERDGDRFICIGINVLVEYYFKVILYTDSDRNILNIGCHLMKHDINQNSNEEVQEITLFDLDSLKNNRLKFLNGDLINRIPTSLLDIHKKPSGNFNKKNTEAALGRILGQFGKTFLADDNAGNKQPSPKKKTRSKKKPNRARGKRSDGGEKKRQLHQRHNSEELYANSGTATDAGVDLNKQTQHP